MIKNTKINEMKDGQILSGLYIVKNHFMGQTRKGSNYLSMVLKDKTGEIGAKVWTITDNMQIDDIQDGWYLCVHGKVSEYEGTLQLTLDALKPPTKEDLEKVDIRDIVPSSPFSPEEVFEDIYTGLLTTFKDKQMAAFIQAILRENEQMLYIVPAAKTVHHAVVGGLLWHMKGMLDVGESISKLYPINSDLLKSGIILHDIAKLQEFILSPIGLVTDYSVKGCLLGHIALGVSYIEKMAQKYPLDEEKKMLLQHMVLSHHGEPDKGSPVRPAFLEAFLLNCIDGMDAHARIFMDMEETMQPGELSKPVFGLNNTRVYKHFDMD